MVKPLSTHYHHVHFFGKDFTYDFFVPDEDGGYFDLSTVSATPTIYIFSTLPSREVAIAGTGAIKTITSWTTVTDPYDGKRIAISAIDDPDPTSTIYRYEYYIAVNYYLQDSEQLQTDIRLLPLERARGVHAPISTDQALLQNIYADVDLISSSNDQTAKIGQARRILKSELSAKGFDWASIWEPAVLDDAVAYKALQLIMLDNMEAPGDQFFERASFYKKEYDSLVASTKLQIEENQNNITVPEAPGNFIRVIR